MSAGFFGSFFKRAPERERRDTPDPNESGRAAASDPVSESAPARNASEQAEAPVDAPARPPAAAQRLGWLTDFIDEQAPPASAPPNEATREPAPARPENPPPPPSPDAERDDGVDADYKGLRQVIQSYEAAIDERPYWMTEKDGPDPFRRESYPPNSRDVVREVDNVEPPDLQSVSGDGDGKSTPPEASYHEPSYDDHPSGPEPTSQADAGAEVDEPEPASETEPEPEPEQIPDASIDEALIEEIRRKDRVVGMLLRKEIVDQQQIANAQRERERKGSKELLWRVLAGLSTVDAEAVYAEAASVYAFKFADLEKVALDVAFARSVMDTFSEDKRETMLDMRVLPFQAAMEGRTGAIKLIFITHDPTHPDLNRFMQDMKLERFELQYAPESVVKAFIQEAFPRKNEYLERMSEGGMRYDLGASFQEDASLIDEDALEAEISRSSLINLFEATLVEAVRRGASDIHIYPNAAKNIEVHFRVDGRLGHWLTEEKVHPEALLAVIKDNAMNVDRFERDSAQDGFIQRWIDDALIRFRVSVLPIANATQELRSESIVIRVLDDRKVITDLTKLGLLDTAKERFEMAISQPHGMVILTGPTGSGKSTTLVAAMHQVVTPEVNVLTVEDPVEYIIPGVRQIKLNHKLGLEEALRAILRHDPDVVMVGEMRDKQTADLAIKLANTGHLTFSTLHTNDAPSAVSRLYKMGIEPFLIAYAINMVVAQRLIRTLCPECKVEDPDPDHVMLKKLGFTDEDIATRTIYKTGDNPSCKSCKGTNYKGRRAVTEALYFSRPIRHLIVEAQNMIDEEAIRKLAVQEGMLTLRDSAREIVKMGETSITEMIRVVTTDS